MDTNPVEGVPEEIQMSNVWEGKGESHGTQWARIADLSWRYKNQAQGENYIL